MLAWGGAEVGTWVGGFQRSQGRREAKPPAPSLTDALPDVLGPLPPDAVDPDQEGVLRLQEVGQGGLQGAVPRAADGQRQGVPGLEGVLDALLDFVHDLGAGAHGSGAAPLPAPARTPLRGARPSGAYLEHLLVHVPYHLLPARRQDARGQVGGAGPQQEPPGDGQGLAQGCWGGHQQLVGGHGPHPTCRLVPQGGAGRAQGPEHLPAGCARLAWGGQAREWPGGEAWHRASAAAAAFRCALLSPVQLSMLVQHVRAWQRGC